MEILDNPKVILNKAMFSRKPWPEPVYWYYMQGPKGWEFITVDGEELYAVTDNQYKNWSKAVLMRSTKYIKEAIH